MQCDSIIDLKPFYHGPHDEWRNIIFLYRSSERADVYILIEREAFQYASGDYGSPNLPEYFGGGSECLTIYFQCADVFPSLLKFSN